MAEVSVADARTRLTRLLQKVEAGEPVQIARRGRPVAVLISQADYERLAHARPSFIEFVDTWRTEMREQAVAFASEADFEGLRDQAERAAPAFD